MSAKGRYVNVQDTDREMMQHVPSGEVYVVECIDGEIIGACGPIHHSEQAHPLYDFDLTDEDVDWARCQEWRLRNMGGK